MISEPPYIRDHKKAERDTHARIALFRKIANTYGYAMTAAAVLQPYVDGAEFGVPNYGLAVTAVALHIIAIYIASVNPETSDD